MPDRTSLRARLPGALRVLASPSATPWYAVALMFGFLLNAYSFAPVHPLAVLRTFVLGILFAAALTVVLAALLRHRPAGGFVAAVLIGALLGYGRASSILAGYLRQGLALKVVLGLVALAALIGVAWLFWRFVRRPSGWSQVTYALNVVGVIFVAVGLLGAFRSGALPTAAGELLAPVRSPIGQAAPGAPDIYLVMLDGYPRHDVIERVFGWDNTPFLDALRQRGFEVGVTNSANYLFTPYSLGSMWHMSHIPDIPEMGPVLRGEVPFEPTVRQMVNHNRSFELLRERGYRIVTVAPPFEDVALRSADEYIDNGGINEFETSLVERTALDRITRTLAPDALFQQERDRVTFALDQLGRISAAPSDGPRLVFVHFVAPHMPAVFGPNGEPVRTPYIQFFWVDSAPQRGMDREEFRRLALGQLQYVSTAVVPALDTLLANDPEALVLLFGDHGSGVGMDWEDVPQSDLGERFGNLFAARTPGRSGVFDVNASLVNTFPALFEGYFGLTVPRLPDLHYAWRDGKETDLYLWEGDPG